MTKFKAFVRSFYKNIIVKRKYRALMALLFDSTYRRDINNLHLLTKNCTKKEVERIHVDALVAGHRVIYPGYALDLFGMVETLPAIRVVKDPTRNKYVVVDGNHRLPALLMHARSSGSYSVICEVIS